METRQKRTGPSAGPLRRSGARSGAHLRTGSDGSRCPWCGSPVPGPFFVESHADGDVVRSLCAVCGGTMEVELVITLAHHVSLPAEVLKKILTVGQKVRKNPRWDWCVCAPAKWKTGSACRCKDGIFTVLSAEKDARCGIGWKVSAGDGEFVIGPCDGATFLPVDVDGLGTSAAWPGRK